MASGKTRSSTREEGENPALAPNSLQAVSVERMRPKGLCLPGHWETEKADAPAQAAIFARPIRKPEDLRTYEHTPFRQAGYFENEHYARQFDFFATAAVFL